MTADLDRVKFALQTLIRYLLTVQQFTQKDVLEEVQAHEPDFTREQLLNFLNRSASGRTHERHIRLLKPAILAIYDRRELWTAPFLLELKKIPINTEAPGARAPLLPSTQSRGGLAGWSDTYLAEDPRRELTNGLWLVARISTNVFDDADEPEFSVSLLDLTAPIDVETELQPFAYSLSGKFDRSVDSYEGFVLQDQDRINLLGRGRGTRGRRLTLLSGIARQPTQDDRRPVMRGQMRGYSYNWTPFASNFHAERVKSMDSLTPANMPCERERYLKMCGVYTRKKLVLDELPFYPELIDQLECWSKKDMVLRDR